MNKLKEILLNSIIATCLVALVSTSFYFATKRAITKCKQHNSTVEQVRACLNI